MDWSRIKTMFIYLFAVVNIILLCFFGYTVYKNKAEIVQEKEIIEKSMKQDNVIIEDSTVKKENLGYINATISDLKDIKTEDQSLSLDIIKIDKYNMLKVSSENVIANVKDSNYKIELDRFLAEKFNSNYAYVFAKYDHTLKTITYTQVFEGLKIVDNKNARIIFKVEDNGDILGYSQTALTNVKKDKLEVLATKTQVVNKLYQEDVIPKNSRVQATLGYYTYISQVENQVLIPTWIVEVISEEQSKTYYVDAINLKVLEKN